MFGANFSSLLGLLSADGSTLPNSGYLAGAADDRALGVALTGLNSAVVVGMTQSADFPTTAGVLQPSAPASYNGFILQVSFAPAVAIPGDFDGNGDTDLVWQNDTTRRVSVWFMGGTNGITALEVAYPAAQSSDSGWTLVSIADFDRNGCPDLVWQNSTSRQVRVWYMGGSRCMTVGGTSYPAPGNYPGWTLVSVADLDRNGAPDLVWQDDATRQVGVWFMSGTQGADLLGIGMAAVGNYAGWKVVGAADFNQDGVPDLLWQDDTTRQVGVWFMGGSQGTSRLGIGMAATGNYAGWKVVGTADFNQDGVPDLMWQYEPTRQVGVWLMGGPQGISLVGIGMPAAGSYPGWRALGPKYSPREPALPR